MRPTALARRYAGALFGAAKDADVVDKIESDLGFLTYSLETVPRLQEVLSHPLIPADQKRGIIAEAFSEEIQQIALHFLGLLIDKRREAILPDVEQEYVRIANEFRGIVPAVVTSAAPLSADERKKLQAKLEESTGKRLDLRLEEDPSLIGGLTVRIGDTIMDGSVRGYLASLKERLLGRE